MTLPISLTCKTQEPSRTRTLRGTRGTSTGEVCGGGGSGREGGTERPPASPGPDCWTRWWCLQQMGGEVLLLVFGPLTTSVVSLGSMKGPSWDHSGSSLLPKHAYPGLEQAQPPGPHLPACLPMPPLHLSSLPPSPIQKSLFLWWLVSEGGC